MGQTFGVCSVGGVGLLSFDVGGVVYKMFLRIEKLAGVKDNINILSVAFVFIT